MPFHITVLNGSQLPYDPPLDLELLADSVPLARARTDATGRAEFAADVQPAARLAVRLVTVDPPRGNDTTSPSASGGVTSTSRRTATSEGAQERRLTGVLER